MLGQRAVLERDRPIDQREPIDGDVEPLLGRLRAFEQVGEVEAPLSRTMRRVGLRKSLSDPDVAPRERHMFSRTSRSSQSANGVPPPGSATRSPWIASLPLSRLTSTRSIATGRFVIAWSRSDRDMPRDRWEGIEYRGDRGQQSQQDTWPITTSDRCDLMFMVLLADFSMPTVLVS